MALTDASRLADFGSGIGTGGAVLQVDNANNRIGLGTDNPQTMVQVGSGITMDGDNITATKFFGDGSALQNVGFDTSVISANAITVTGVVTATTFAGALSGNATSATSATTATSATNAAGLTGTPDLSIGNLQVGIITATGNVTVGGTLSYEDVTNVDSVGVVTARTGVRVSAGGVIVTGVSTFNDDIKGDNATNISGINSVTATSFYGNGSNLEGVVSGIALRQNGAAKNGSLTILDLTTGASITTDSNNASTGIATVSFSVGITTAAASGGEVTLNLSSAQDHKVTASGVTTITCSGGTEGESHTVRIVNSGITTIGFSTYFLFPSGSAPSIPTASATISLLSFTVHRVGAAGTQLLAGASLNFS